MNKIILFPLILLVACVHTETISPRPANAKLLQPNYIPTPTRDDGGVTIASTNFDGMLNTVNSGKNSLDCDSPGFSVNIDNANGTKNYVFDSNGEPCKAPEILFDGRNAKDRRPPPPSLHVAFHDQLSVQPKTADTSPLYIGLTQATKPNSPEEFATTGGTPIDTHKWKQEGLDIADTANKWAERKDASKREMGRISTNTNIKKYQSEIAMLKERLRNAERSKETEIQRASRLQTEADSAKKRIEARTLSAEQQEEKARTEMFELKKRLGEYERVNQRLATNSKTREEQYRARISKISADLNVAEARAEDVRKELVLEAAQKIAAAERLAFAARMAEREALERESARKKQEGEILMQRAMALEQGRTIVIPGLSDQIGRIINPIPIALEDAPVMVHSEGKSLKALLDGVFADVKPMVGNWNISWQLSNGNKFLLEETWTLTAEATLGEILQFITKRVRETHNVTLAFKRFDKAKLLVISDGSSFPASK